ncbi:GLEYA domain-containing protein [Fusarium oxysporum II5]|nr:GLEYA domain-containing protein [Fusarium oxysporum II5]
MKSIITFAGLAFASFAAAGPCRPRTTTTAAAAVSSSTEIASSTATETAASTSTDYSVPVVSESSTLATVIVSETSATETSAAETSTVGTTTAETSAAGTTTAETTTATTTAETTTAEGTTTADTTTAETTTAEGTTTADTTTTTTAETTTAEATTTDAETTSGTATETTTSAEPTADQSCDNAGLEYAIYEHTFYNSDPPHFSSFDPTFFHTATPTFQGETTRIGIPPGTASDTSFAIYADSPVQRFQYKAVNHQAFLYAPDTGDYKVTIPNSDEITLIWFGTKAISGWTRQNADLEQDYPGGTSKSFTIHLTAGTYTPFRLLWANAQGDLNFIAEVQAPDGTVIVNGDGSDNRYFVRFACDESTPSFPAFGGSG